MPASTDLLGRDALLRDVTEMLAAGRSVLLCGPEGIGKTALIAALDTRQLVVVDPFERISRQQAARIRRELDRGAVYLGAASAASGPALGAVGRILWRVSIVRVRELPSAVLCRIVTRELCRLDGATEPDTTWVHAVTGLARGRPGFATAMARFAAEWRRGHGYLPLPELAFAAVREDAITRTTKTTGPRSRPALKEHS